MTGRYRLTKTARKLNIRKTDNRTRVPANLGIKIGGQKVVEKSTRSGYMYARIHGNLSEVVDVFNAVTSPVYDLPVLISFRNNRWEVDEKDTGRYITWESAYLPRHGAQHSFDPYAPGGDIVWVWDNQMMPLAPIPSGTSGAGNILIEPYTYWSTANNQWQTAGGSYTANILAYKPTGTTAKMVLVYADVNGATQLLAGSNFVATLTGTSDVLDYIPALPSNDDIPITAVRLVSGTSVVSWDNMYGVRPWFTSSGGGGTGSSGSTTLNENEIAFGSSTDTVTSNPNLFVEDSGDAAYKSIHINAPIDTNDITAYYSLNVGTDPDGDLVPVAIWAYGNMPNIDFYYANGTAASPNSAAKNDYLGELRFMGFDEISGGGLFTTAAGMYAAVDESFSLGYGTHLHFYVHASGTKTTDWGGADIYYDLFRPFGDIQLNTGSAYYFNLRDSNGSWRLITSGSDLVSQKRIAGAWTTIGYLGSGSSGGGGSVTLTEKEIAYGSATDEVTSSPKFTVESSYAAGFPSIWINTQDDAENYHQYYSLNVGIDADNNVSNEALWSYGYSNYIDFYRANGTPASPTSLLNNNEVGQLGFYGYRNNQWAMAGIIGIYAHEDWGNSYGGYFSFLTAQTGTSGFQREPLRLYAEEARFGGDIVLPTGTSTHGLGMLYFGDPDTDGSWRTTRSGNNLVFQRRESGVWVTKQTISA